MCDGNSSSKHIVQIVHTEVHGLEVLLRLV